MTGETLEKPPALLLPPAKLRPNLYSNQLSLKGKEKFIEEKGVHKFTARYDMFHGILKRVSEMKLNGSLDSEEPSTGSEKSESSTPKRAQRHVQSGSVDERSSASNFEDESSVSSITGSDNCPHYEEILRAGCKRYSCTSLPTFPGYTEGNISSFRESFPPPPSPTKLHQSVPCRSLSKEYATKLRSKRQDAQDPCRPKSLNFDVEEGPARSFFADVNDNCTKCCEGSFTLEQDRQPEGITDTEKHQLEMFFRSLRTDVFVCSSLANLYFGWKEDEGIWSYRHTGVVVVVFDFGDTRSRNKRRIQILLAERGTCFPLWKDTIDNLSAYHKSGTAFHTMHLSSDHRQMAGLSFDCPLEAEKLLKHLEELTSNPENINISVPFSKKKKSASKKKAVSLPHKKQISNPCLFLHVTSVAARDKPIYMSLQTLIDNEIIKKKENIS